VEGKRRAAPLLALVLALVLVLALALVLVLRPSARATRELARTERRETQR